MKRNWGDHEKDVQRQIQLICNNHIIKYIGQEDFPHSRNKPDNCIEIMDQLIIFDAKSPAMMILVISKIYKRPNRKS